MKRLFLFFILTCSFLTRGQCLDKSHVKVELLADTLSIQPGRSFWVAVHLSMDKEWHTYWKNPGDSGLPTKIEWNLPQGFTAGPIGWPVPQKISASPLMSFGYTDDATLLTKITPPTVIKNFDRVKIQAQVKWLECKEECVPGQASVVLKLPIRIENPLPNLENGKMFFQANFALPLVQSEWRIEAQQNQTNLYLSLIPNQGELPTLTDVFFFPNDQGGIDNAAPQVLIREKDRYILNVKKSEISTSTIKFVNGVLYSETGWRGLNSERGLLIDAPIHPISNGSKTSQPKNSELTIWSALIFAFLGGLLLNLMPCVLPVLSIKVMGFIKQGATAFPERVTHAMLYGLGVVGTFLSLAALLYILRSSGESLGWGFQLQSPSFVIFLIGLMYMMSLNMLGLYEIGVGFLRLGGSQADKSSLLGSFMSGVLATVLATPCTAPFMGSAMGFALSIPPLQAALIFGALGVGMATPYILLVIQPLFLKFLPKPGRWMSTLKIVMGILMLATVGWLIFVLTQQKGTVSLFWLIPGLVIMTFSGWIYGHWSGYNHSRKVRILSTLSAAILVMVGFLLCLNAARVQKSVPSISVSQSNWEPYSDERLAELRNLGHPVFIDFSASWCLTCQVNERVTLQSTDVQNQFKVKNVALLKADWTLRDEKITRALERYKRNGVPTYVLYDSNPMSGPVILPEVLTPSIVIHALEKI